MSQLDVTQLLNQGLNLQRQGALAEAEALYRQVLERQPHHPQAWHLLGFLRAQLGDNRQAVELVRRGIALDPNDVTMHINLGLWLAELRQFVEAVASQRQAVRLAPESSIAHYNLGTALEGAGKMDEAIAAYRESLRIDPAQVPAWNNLASIHADRAEFEDAIHAIEQALALVPNQAALHGSLVSLLLYYPGHDAKSQSEALAAWRRKHADPLKKFIRPHTNNRTPDRPLRIGYVSADFRDHVVARNIWPLFQHHDPRQFELFCFAELQTPDAMTDRFRRVAKRFEIITGRTDEQAAELIRACQIDILVDLSLHTTHNRLLIFAHKPAPVQVTFAGYPGSTGLQTIDYRLTDPYLDPMGQNDAIYSEESIRLPHSFWCFDPMSEVPAVGGLPALATGKITFGCLNRFRKINRPLLALWAQLLAAVPDSRMILLAPVGAHERIHAYMESQRIDAKRMILKAFLPRAEYLNLYQQIDIGLDTHPYNGHTTSLESFFMGVPVITRVGRTVVGRAGLSQLMNLGMPELAADSDDEFVKLAAGLAGDLPRLSGIRSGLRKRMEDSPLMNGAGFARDIESAYRSMWRKWCAGSVSAG